MRWVLLGTALGRCDCGNRGGLMWIIWTPWGLAVVKVEVGTCS